MNNPQRNIRENSNIFYALSYAVEKWRGGIGLSKKAIYSVKKGVSPFVHSYSTLNRYSGIAKEFCNFLKENGVNRLDKLTYGVTSKFFDVKVGRGLSQKTLKVNLCAIEKFLDTVNRTDISSKLRDDFDKIYIQGRPSGKTIGFSNPESVVSKVYERNSAHGVMAELQYLTGARIGDLKKIELDIEKKAVVIEGSKGGRDRVIDFSDRQERFDRIVQLKEDLDKAINDTSWKQLRETYSDSVRHACNVLKEIYTGPHAFRASYAEERFEELREKGLDDDKKTADHVLTQELGHNRISMSMYYR